LRKADFFAGLIGLFFSAFMYWQSLQFPKIGITMAGPRFFPQILAVLLGVLSICLIFRCILAKNKVVEPESPEEAEIEKKIPIVKIFSAITASIVYAFAMKYIGFLISTFSYFAFLMLLMQEKKRFVKAFISAGMVTGVTYVIFGLLLKASLPIGVIFR